MNITGTDPHKGYSDAAYNASPEGKSRRKKYRHDNSKWETNASYLSRPIVAIDGEGLNLPDGSHSYVMLAISDHKPLIDVNGLQTKKILHYVWSRMSTKAINVIYGGGYDFNMWLKPSVDADTLRALYNGTYMGLGVEVEGFQVKWARGKSFQIKKDGRTVTIYDVAPFFQCPFIKACDDYLGEYEGRDELVREKAKRGNFKAEDLDGISHYNQLELVLLEKLMIEFRDRCNRVGLRPKRWDGPGAIAAVLYQREGVKDHLDKNVPEGPSEAARFAYAGGRFEMIKYGSVEGDVFEYDINSAYPSAMTQLPSMVGGTWVHHDGDIGDQQFAMYKVRTKITNKKIPGPVFVRGPKGNVSYPAEAETWIWSPEMAAVRNYCDKIPGASYTVLEVWNYTPPVGSPKPFAFINKLYAERQNLKAQGDGAHTAVKLALNSCYGKTAQQVGWIPATEEHPLRIPPFHQLEWAGYTTSHCRAKILNAVVLDPESVIAIETDALFTSRPLDLPIGPGLGAWEEVRFTSLTYVQSGHYYGTLLKADKNGNREVSKMRGVDRGEINRKMVEDALQEIEPDRFLQAPLTRFYGAGVALMRGLDQWWCRWKTETKTLSLFPTGKRIHHGCEECTDADGRFYAHLRVNVWHTTICPITRAGRVSNQFPVEWINPNPKMSELDDARRQERDFEV